MEATINDSIAVQEFAVTNETNNQDWQQWLAQAAAACDVDPESFVRAAWGAYFEAHPEMREQLEELHLIAELEQLRKNRRIALA